ncbi:HAMP domain-containing sensor histidine kinase [Cutibacterium equinum]|uniref:Sensor-like histidine kinase SenX3 n=1 Tax=Cutibacterium equinum TaxID=3016342 RepID=A0ABY7QXG1_9ACTN|nr:HAMP domain-containing sensor histidine kinase [Cutibacterium equinum]WCC79094.1 HAMP domain-containing sensor histidine kinase [Cutibacterium equinum]
MIAEVLQAVAATLVIGVLGALITHRLARTHARASAFAGPVTVVLALAAGVWVGVQRMLLDPSVPLILLAATAPVALLIGVLSVADTRRRQAEIDAELGRRELIAGMSHDLRTPLAGIRAMAEALEDEVAPDPKRYYAGIIAQTKRVSEMVEDMLALSDISATKPDVSFDLVDLTDLLSDQVAQIAPLATKRDVRLEFQPDESVEAEVHASQVSRAIQNLLSNAVTYTSAGSVVTATVARVGGKARIEVQDQCGGLSPEALANATRSGWRGDEARTPRPGEGAGLGLPVVVSVAKAHGGAFSLKNQDDGCRATLELPVHRM